MNPKHRDSTAFLRVCSGRFERDLVVKHHRMDKELRLSRPHSMLAQDRNTVDLAYPGDIVGVINPGIFAIGDTISLTAGFNFKPLPSFQPEIFARVRPKDVAKRKSFDKGVEQMTAEGTVQMLKSWDELDFFVAAVGRLQFDVLQYRLKAEYGVDTELETLALYLQRLARGQPGKLRPAGAGLEDQGQAKPPGHPLQDPLGQGLYRPQMPGPFLRGHGVKHRPKSLSPQAAFGGAQGTQG